MQNPLVLLLGVEALDGSPLPEKLTIPNCCDMSMNEEKKNYIQGRIAQCLQSLSHLQKNVIIADLAVKLMAVKTWIGLLAVITSFVLGRDKVDQIILVREWSRIEKETRANGPLAAIQEEQDALRNKLNQASDKETKLMEDITSYVAKQGDLTKFVSHLTEQSEVLESWHSLNQTMDEQ